MLAKLCVATTIGLISTLPSQSHAATSWQCSGLTETFVNNCGNKNRQFHICLGPNGKNGQSNFTLRPGYPPRLTNCMYLGILQEAHCVV